METNAAKIRGISDHLFLQLIFCHVNDGDRPKTKIKSVTNLIFLKAEPEINNEIVNETNAAKSEENQTIHFYN
jgi:hypothetical protein